MFHEIRIQEAGNRLVFKYDPISNLIQIPVRGRGMYVVDLSERREEILGALTFDAEGDRIEEVSSFGV